MADEEMADADEHPDALAELSSLVGSQGDHAADGAADADSVDLGALAASSRPLRVSEDDAEHLLDLRKLALADGAGEAADAAQEPATTRALPVDPAPSVDAAGVASTVEEPEPVVARPRAGRGPIWAALLLGFGAGFALGAVSFRNIEAPASPGLAQPPDGQAGPVGASAAVDPPQPNGVARGVDEVDRRPMAALPGGATKASAGEAEPAAGLERDPERGTNSTTPPAGPAPLAAAPARPAVRAAPSVAPASESGERAADEPEASDDADDTREGDRTLAAAFGAESSRSATAPARDMDDLLDQAFENPAQRAARQQDALGAPERLPTAPSREQVSEAMAILLPAIRGCAMGQTGLATASIVVAQTGKVASVAVAGAPFAGAASGRCMEGVIRKARFPRFSQPTFRVKFPFSIR